MHCMLLPFWLTFMQTLCNELREIILIKESQDSMLNLMLIKDAFIMHCMLLPFWLKVMQTLFYELRPMILIKESKDSVSYWKPINAFGMPIVTVQIIGVLNTIVSQGDNPARGGMEICNPPGYFISANADRDYPGGWIILAEIIRGDAFWRGWFTTGHRRCRWLPTSATSDTRDRL